MLHSRISASSTIVSKKNSSLSFSFAINILHQLNLCKQFFIIQIRIKRCYFRIASNLNKTLFMNSFLNMILVLGVGFWESAYFPLLQLEQSYLFPGRKETSACPAFFSFLWSIEFSLSAVFVA